VSVFSDEDIRSYLRLYSEPFDDLSEDENWWMLGTIHVSKKHATFRAGFGHPIVSSTKFVIQEFETDDVRGCAIALLSGSKPPAYFAGWVPRLREPEATRWVKALNDAIQRVLPHRTELPQSIQSNETALVFESGSESAPDDPFGLETLRLSESGQLTYERRRHELRSNVVGTVEPDRARTLVEALRRTSFPAPPQTRFVPGASIVRITTVPSNESVRVDYFAALRMDGYRDVVRELSQLAAGLRDTNSQVLSEWKFSAD
jgi:hypothetical protein